LPHQAAEDMQERALAASGRADNGHELAFGNLQVESGQRIDGAAIANVALGNCNGTDELHLSFPLSVGRKATFSGSLYHRAGCAENGDNPPLSALNAADSSYLPMS
jgi:hypothetical protein